MPAKKIMLIARKMFLSLIFVICFVELQITTFSAPGFVPNISAAPGDLDSTFGTGGVVLSDMTPYGSIPTAIAVQGDGKIITAVYGGYDSSGLDFILVRYNQDGTFDSSFGTDGIVSTDIGEGYRDVINSIALQADGKIVAVGSTEAFDSINKLVAVRYISDGSLDSNFGNSGISIIPTGNCDNGLTAATSVAIQTDGKIVVGGTFCGNPVSHGLVRLNSNGVLDTDFGNSGITVTPLNANGFVNLP